MHRYVRMISIVIYVTVTRFSSLSLQATTPTLTPFLSRHVCARTATVDPHQEDCQAQNLTLNTQQPLIQLL